MQYDMYLIITLIVSFQWIKKKLKGPEKELSWLKKILQIANFLEKNKQISVDEWGIKEISKKYKRRL